MSCREIKKLIYAFLFFDENAFCLKKSLLNETTNIVVTNHNSQLQMFN